MTQQSGSGVATQKAQLVDANGNPLGAAGNGLYITPTGLITESLPAPTQVSVVAPRTDNASVNLGDFATPAFFTATFRLVATAVSGTTPSMTVTIIGKDSQGVYSIGAGGVAFTALTAASSTSQVFGAALSTNQSMLSPLYRVQVVITGTTPSFSWYLDMIYK